MMKLQMSSNLGCMDVTWAFLRDGSVLISMLGGSISGSAKGERVGGR